MKNFLENGFFTGINYWGSKSAINMWSEFDAESIENDLSLLRDAKITHLETFGAFCDIGCGNVALLPIDAISVSRISHPKDRFQVGDNIKAIVK